mmetsp:Transcript_7851/g.14950  ORF Transcript_7851/g.14950 Transcript_7851/m.14950 type:complete len:312 (+) Transcript_7851:236-1171(+)|eukprot:scaffold6808_cov144-Amphora_coffeaeformis.AAC.4
MIAPPAAELLEHESIDFASKVILQFVDILDTLGAREWNLRAVGFVTFLFLAAVRQTLGKRQNVEWYALMHNFVAGAGSVVACYLDFYAAEALTGTAEPLRSCAYCGGPLTSLHRILPAITLGYGVLDLFEGLHIGPDFAAHGVATFSIMLFFVESDQPQIVVPFLIMEVSSVVLNLVRAEFLSDTGMMVVQMLFALFFFIFRILISPFIWFRIVEAMYTHSGTDLYKSCINPYVFPTSIMVGLFFHMLNTYWFYKIVRKIRRKLSGKEKVRSNNELNEKEMPSELEEDKENMGAKANGVSNGAVLNGKKHK